MPLLAAAGVLRYGVLGCYLMNGRHGEVKKLTMNQLEGSLASKEALKHGSMAAAMAGEREGHG